jgi:hypothetical protein
MFARGARQKLASDKERAKIEPFLPRALLPSHDKAKPAAAGQSAQWV